MRGPGGVAWPVAQPLTSQPSTAVCVCGVSPLGHQLMHTDREPLARVAAPFGRSFLQVDDPGEMRRTGYCDGDRRCPTRAATETNRGASRRVTSGVRTELGPTTEMPPTTASAVPMTGAPMDIRPGRQSELTR